MDTRIPLWEQRVHVVCKVFRERSSILVKGNAYSVHAFIYPTEWLRPMSQEYDKIIRLVQASTGHKGEPEPGYGKIQFLGYFELLTRKVFFKLLSKFTLQ